MKRKPPKEFFTTWIFEAFDRDPDFFQKRMFGGLAAYLHGRMVMVLVEDPGERSYRGKSWKFDIWDGVMLPIEKIYHAPLQKEFPGLVSHPVLGKWLYLPARYEDFETRAREVAAGIAGGDKRFGIEPKMKKRSG